MTKPEKSILKYDSSDDLLHTKACGTMCGKQAKRKSEENRPGGSYVARLFWDCCFTTLMKRNISGRSAITDRRGTTRRSK